MLEICRTVSERSIVEKGVALLASKRAECVFLSLRLEAHHGFIIERFWKDQLVDWC